MDAPFKDSSQVKFKGISKSQQVTQGQNSIDLVVPFDSITNGIELLNTVLGESAQLQVLDTPNLIGLGENAIIDSFPHSPRFCRAETTKLKTNYGARVKEGWTVRIIFNSLSEKTVYANLDLHKTSQSLGNFWEQQ